MSKKVLLENNFNYKFITYNDKEKCGEFDYNTIEKSIKYSENNIALLTFSNKNNKIKCKIEMFNKMLPNWSKKVEFDYTCIDKFNKIDKIMTDKKCIELVKEKI